MFDETMYKQALNASPLCSKQREVKVNDEKAYKTE
jgi:hypothetical protein